MLYQGRFIRIGINVERNQERWMKWGETIMLNVSNSEFPGKY